VCQLDLSKNNKFSGDYIFCCQLGNIKNGSSKKKVLNVISRPKKNEQPERTVAATRRMLEASGQTDNKKISKKHGKISCQQSDSNKPEADKRAKKPKKGPEQNRESSPQKDAMISKKSELRDQQEVEVTDLKKQNNASNKEMDVQEYNTDSSNRTDNITQQKSNSKKKQEENKKVMTYEDFFERSDTNNPKKNKRQK